MKIKKLKDILDYRVKVFVNHNHGLRTYSLIDLDDRKIGSFTIDIDYNESGKEVFDSGNLQALSLSEEYRGMGISKLVFRILIQEAKKTGYNSLFLSVLMDNIPAVNLYKSLGFETIGTNEKYYTMSLDI
jgi:ribosomal protein S18 acetylase RimI-like enzyme